MHRVIMNSRVVRDDLKQIYHCAVNSVKSDNLIKNHITLNSNQLIVKDSSRGKEKSFSLQNREIYILGAGKAVLKMCEEFLNQIDRVNGQSNNQIKVNSGIISVPMGSIGNDLIFDKYNVKYYCGAKNNMPDERSHNTTEKIIKLIETAKHNATKSNKMIPLLISFISGGGSTLLTCPKPSLNLTEKCSLITQLVQSGATITELNKVRRCLSVVKCGKLARFAIENSDCIELISFIVSDIIGDPIELIASGPTVLCNDITKPGHEALSILNKHNIVIDDKIKRLILSEDDLIHFEPNSRLTNIVIGNNTVALESAKHKAAQLGYKVIFMGNDIEGEASKIGTEWAHRGMEFKFSLNEKDNFKGVCMLGGGETTVSMEQTPHTNIGIGGRCQEMGLAFYRSSYDYTDGKLVFLAAGTDGQDGPTPSAGCIVQSGMSLDKNYKGIYDQSAKDLLNHNSHNFWNSYYNDWLIGDGPTGTNVMDIYCMIKY